MDTNQVPELIEYHNSEHYTFNTRRMGNLRGNLTPCLICGKGIKNLDKAAWVHVVAGGGMILRPDLEWEDGLSDLGAQPIGADCLRQHPELKPYVIK